MRLICCDAIDYLRRCRDRAVIHDALIADPPDNLGLDYADSTTGDRMPAADYYRFLEQLLRWALPCTRVLWFSYYHGHDLEVKSMVRDVLKHWHPSYQWRQFLWTFTFSQYTDNDCSVAYRPILRLSRPDWQPDVSRIRVPSERMLVGDSRAAGPRVPSNLWAFPRVVGNAQERRPHHPTQHPEALYERMLLMSGGDNATDLFAGSGTIFRAARKLSMTNVTGVELSPTYCEHMSREHHIPVEYLRDT